MDVPKEKKRMKQEDDIKQAIETMRKGGVILYPTDTVWGIGCDATNVEAVKRVYQIKQREDSKALICLVDSDARMQRYFRNVPDVAWQLIDSLKEATDAKPTTLILDGAINLAPNLIAEDGSLGIRITNEPFSKELCYRFQKAIVRTNQGLSFYCGWQKRSSNNLVFNNLIQISRGYKTVDNTQLLCLQAAYSMPLFYPDWNIGNALYIKRIRAKMFYDNTWVDNSGKHSRLESSGCDFTADFHIYRLPVPIAAGVRYARRITRNDNYFGLLLSMNFNEMMGNRR